jgi:hypothetical protein
MDPWQPSDPTLPSSFTTAERELIRGEMGPHFGQLPSLADGLLLRTGRDGPQKGEPKLPPAARSMLERGLVEVRAGRCGPRAFFPEAGLAVLRQPLRDRRAMDPARFAHLRRELGLQPEPGTGDPARFGQPIDADRHRPVSSRRARLLVAYAGPNGWS